MRKTLLVGMSLLCIGTALVACNEDEKGSRYPFSEYSPLPYNTKPSHGRNDSFAPEYYNTLRRYCIETQHKKPWECANVEYLHRAMFRTDSWSNGGMGKDAVAPSR